ncbi:hypothetical protein LTR97_002061 [Elasticomyces elasticus]|uniref:F-box domain-containing protein n=1 Tax=Elasticomyces elasticus TaxID=574655 RepID=A0AAN8A532_9PEZI|nr:hypothetical protein LTR97_002061 [Elasticomyces elasticus]
MSDLQNTADLLRILATLSTPDKPPDGRNLLESLPPELQLRIFEYTGYGDVFTLKQVNKHFHGLVKPEKWPAEDKAKFVKKVQLFPQHNRIHMKITHTMENEMVFDSNGFACYSCYRVRPQDHFSLSQCIAKNSKHSKQDLYSETGCGRFCVSCGLESGKYRVGTLIGVVSYMGITKACPPYACESALQTFCAGCRSFAYNMVGLNNTTWCNGCMLWTKTRADRNYRYELAKTKAEYLRFFECPQCKELTLACDDDKRRCCYCKRDICRSCGCVANKAGDWWCGLACSKAGWDFMMKTVVDGWPLQLTLDKKVREKHVERDPEKKKMTDLLGCEDVEEALSWLSL